MNDLVKIFEQARAMMHEKDIPVDVLDMTPLDMSPEDFRAYLDNYELLQYVNRRMRGEPVTRL